MFELIRVDRGDDVHQIEFCIQEISVKSDRPLVRIEQLSRALDRGSPINMMYFLISHKNTVQNSFGGPEILPVWSRSAAGLLATYLASTGDITEVLIYPSGCVAGARFLKYPNQFIFSQCSLRAMAAAAPVMVLYSTTGVISPGNCRVRVMWAIAHIWMLYMGGMICR